MAAAGIAEFLNHVVHHQFSDAGIYRRGSCSVEVLRAAIGARGEIVKETHVCDLENKQMEDMFRGPQYQASKECLAMTLASANNFGYTFPAIRGIQAGREYYTTMCPLRLIPKIFLFDEEEMPVAMRAQRTLNKNRLPEMSRYILDNPEDYCFSAITASIDSAVSFEALGGTGEVSRIGLLRVPMDARFIINDGQHRRAAVEQALRENPDLGSETIAVVFFLDHGLARCQQMFADLNRYAIRPSKSIGVLYDHRDDKANLTRLMVLKSPFFKDIVEFESSTLSPRSRKLFTLSALYNANADLLDNLEIQNSEQAASRATEYWNEVSKYIPEWEHVRQRKTTAGEIRQEFIHSHGIVLQSLGQVGNTLLREHPEDWKKRLADIAKINWRRDNSKTWEGRAMVGGRVTKGTQNVVLTTNVIKKFLKLSLSPMEQRAEGALRHG
jgi:DNA sulfur modification protein DndB